MGSLEEAQAVIDKFNSEDFSLEAAEKFIAECIPTVTIFSKDPAHHPNVIKFFNSPNAKALLAEIYDAQAILTGKD